MTLSGWLFGLLVALAAFGFTALLTAFLLLFLSFWGAHVADTEADELERVWHEGDTEAFEAWCQERSAGR